MCCFTQPVIDVNSTKIFVRVCDRTQFLAYQMKLSADKDLAMILPLPIANKDKATSNTLPLKFIDLSGYEDFFKDIQRCFRVPPTRFTKRDIACAGIESTLLKVYSVGSFEASYVPSISDFHRLDPRFRLSNDIWKKLPQYESYGFAVFKLKPGNHKIHPMALKFITQNNNISFFPTLHIHNGNLDSQSEFDHILYLQTNSNVDSFWQKAFYSPTEKMDINNLLKGDRTKGMISAATPLYRKVLKGLLMNQDILVAN